MNFLLLLNSPSPKLSTLNFIFISLSSSLFFSIVAEFPSRYRISSKMWVYLPFPYSFIKDPFWTHSVRFWTALFSCFWNFTVWIDLTIWTNLTVVIKFRFVHRIRFRYSGIRIRKFEFEFENPNLDNFL